MRERSGKKGTVIFFPLISVRVSRTRWFFKHSTAACLAVLCLVLNLFFVSTAHSRENMLSGGAGIRQAYDSNVYRANNNETSEWTTALVTSVNFSSKGQYDEVALLYAPSFVLNQRTDDTRIDHNLTLKADRKLSERLQLALKETFVKAEDPYNDAESGIELSDTRGNKRYWTNNAKVEGKYNYVKDSFLAVSYLNHVLDNSGVNEEDFVKHQPGVSLTHSFSNYWQSRLAYDFTSAEFDQSDNLKINTVEFRQTYNYSPHDKYFGQYRFSGNEYDGTKDDFVIHAPSLGWERILSEQANLSLQAGTSLLDREGRDNKAAFFGKLSYDQKIQEGMFRFMSSAGHDEQKFNGSSSDGLSKYWDMKGSMEYKLLKDLSTTLSAKYREDRYIWSITEDKEKVFQTGCTISYAFSQWYMLSVGYTYSQRAADFAIREYEDNRVFVELRATKDLWKW